MKPVVGGRLFGPAAPLVESFHQRLLRVGNHEVDDRRGTTGQACRRTTEKVFTGHGAHEGQLHMGMGVDAARHQVLAAAIEYFAACGNIQIRANGAN